MSDNKMMDMLNQVLDLRWEDFSKTTVERAKWIVADTLLVMLSGVRSSPESQRFLQNSKIPENMNCVGVRIPGTGVCLSSADAELLFGTSIVCNEMDEGSQFAKGHPAAHLIPAMYVESANRDVSGKQFLRALIIGYEIAARFGYAGKMKDDMHPHGTWGIIGSAAAIGILQGKSKEQLIRSILLAASLPLSTSWESAVTGQTVRNLYAGLGNVIASYVQQFEAAGFISSEHVVRHLWGHIMSEGIDDALFVDRLLEPLLIDRNYFKLYPACRFSHSAIEAFLKLLAAEKINTTDIESIDVETYSLSARLKDPSPQTFLAAKFSIPFLLSVLAHGESLFDANTETIFKNSSIRLLAEKINVQANPDMSLMLPEKRPARVTVRLKGGAQLTCAVKDAPDGFDEQSSQKGLKEKHFNIMSKWSDQETVKQWINAILKLDEMENIHNIMKII